MTRIQSILESKLNLEAAVQLGDGGQGRVYQTSINLIQPSIPLVYKKYKDIDRMRFDASVLESMIAFLHGLDLKQTTELLSICSWPIGIVLDDRTNKPCGFLMPKIPSSFYQLTINTVAGAKTGRLNEFQYLLNDARHMSRVYSLNLDDDDRFSLLNKVAEGLSKLHGYAIAIGDVSPKNLLFTLSPFHSVFFLDADAMRFKSSSALIQCETPGWGVREAFGSEQLGTPASDCYKLGLLALRLFAGNQVTRDPSILSDRIPRELKTLITHSIQNDSLARPSISEWTSLLAGYALNQSTSFRQASPQSVFRSNQQVAHGNSNAISQAKALLSKANHELQLGNKQEALTAYNDVLLLDPNLTEAYIARADLKSDLGDNKGAIADYDKLILLRPNQVDLYNNRGCCKYNLGDYQGAHADFTRELSSNPTAVIFYNRASSSLKIGDTISALTDTMSGYALDAKKLSDSSYQEIKDLLERSTLFTLLGAWMRSNWKRNAALRKAATRQSGMPNAPIPPATNLSVASCIALLGAWMSTSWKMNAALKNAAFSQNGVPNPLTDKLKVLWKKSRSKLQLNSSNTLLTRTQTQRVTIALGALLTLGVSCAALIRYDDYLRLTDEKSLLSHVQKLYNSGDYLQCIRKAGDIRSRLRERLRVQASDLRSSCLSGQHTKLLAAITDESSVKNIQTYRQLLEDLRYVANEGYSDNNLQEKIRAARETLKNKMRSYADYLYETSQHINDVVLLYQLLGDYAKAQTLRSEWRRDEQVFNEALSKLEKLDPSQHNPFEMPRFNTAYWNNQFQKRSPRVLVERVVNAAKYYRERGEWEQCEQAAKEALRMGEQINDNSMAASANWYWEQCILGAKAHSGSSGD